MFPRVAVIGAGSIGCVLAAWLHEADRSVQLCARGSLGRIEVTHAGEISEYDVPVVYRPEDTAPADIVFVTTKAQHTAAIGDWLSALTSDATTVVAAQNGVRHAERFAGLVAPAQVVPAAVYIGAERIGPGRVEHRTGNVLLVPRQPGVDVLHEACAGSRLTVRAGEDFLTASWQKLLGNLGANPVTALTLGRSDVLADPSVRALVVDLLTEAVAVGRAEGARLDDSAVDEVLRFYDELPAGSGTSMLYDRLADRSTEHEYLTGAVVRAGERHGIATPANSAVLALMRGLELRLARVD